jgi:diguanylate cyclase (GGDEF)-like protein
MESIQLLLLSLVLISVSFAGANYLAWRLFDHPRHALIWAIAYSLAGVQYSVNLLHDNLPGPASYWLLANSTAFALVICAVWGHRERLGLRTSGVAMLALWMALTAVSLVTILVHPAPGLRTALAPGFAFVGMTSIAAVLLKSGYRPRLAQKVAAVVHFLFGVNQGIAAAIALGLGQAADPEAVRIYHLANFALMPSFYVAMGVSVIFLLATDLSYRLRQLALTDPLTQVANRRGFVSSSLRLLARSSRSGKPLTVILCDLDHFKRVNDEFGHTAGDRALQHFARILLQSVRADDVVGRIGGEEFAVCLGDMSDAQAGEIAERVRLTLAHSPLRDGGREVWLTASYGISTWRDGDDISAMLQRADIALYEAKNAGRDSIHFAQAPAIAAAG